VKTFEFLASLRRLGLKLWLDDGRLRYRAADGVLTPALRAELAARKAEIVDFLTMAASATASTKARISPVSRQQELPLSFAQQRLWFLHELDPDSAAYNVSAALQLRGALNVATLAQCLNEVVRRHEVLRTIFKMVNGRAVQIIKTHVEFHLPVVDLSSVNGREREMLVRELARAESCRPFDLASGLTLRVSVLRLAEDEHVLLLTMHHIVSDGWSMNVLVKEVTALYEAYKAGLPSTLPELAIQYADFAVWQREWLTGPILKEQLVYWRAQLADAPPVLKLPTDYPRPYVQNFRGAKLPFGISHELMEQLEALSRAEGVTLFITLLAAFQSLLARYSSQSQIIVGTPIANRNRRETEALIGFFVNTLALRTDLGGDPPFRQLMERVKEVAMGGYSHQDVPFEKLVEELQPERDMSHSPLFQVAFTLQNTPRLNLNFGGLESSLLAVDNGTAMFDFRIWLEETEQGLDGGLEYKTSLFAAGTMQRMAGHYLTLLEGIVSNPGLRLSELPLVSEAERRQLLFEWNQTATAYPRDATIQEVFQVQVERTPDAIALIWQERQVSYAELNRQANQLARHLRSLGIGPESRVGICAERSIEMIVGLLGILKAGGSYVPIDPEYPLERMSLIMEDAGVVVLLTQEHLLDHLPASWVQMLCLDTDWPLIEVESVENPHPDAVADNLAYVIYTSGSTGQPKGVCVTHRNVVRLVKENDYVSFGADELFLQLASVSFDASTFEIWGSLLNGARLCIMPSQTPSLEELGRALQEYGVTTVWLTAGLFHQMVDERLEDLSGVRQLLAGGDVLSVPHVSSFVRNLEGGRLINGYGPTESTTFACTCTITKESDLRASVPIGRPLANTQVYLLDGHLRPVPIGVSGELHIGGDGLARGYSGQPGLTAEKFIPHPFSLKPGARLYKTGDLARYLPDGRIEFLGRNDYQVKVRGFRIELGEIEAVLAQHSEIREVVVVARQDEPGEKRLVAYLVCKAWDAPPSVSELHRFLRARVPDYMLPSGFVFLESFPLTTNGKVNRRALPAPADARPELEVEYVEARTPVEATLIRIWMEVMDVKRIGIHDNFFELGGHSLLATQIISRLRGIFNTELPLRIVFEKPTVAEMAASLEAEAGVSQSLQSPPIRPVSREGHLPLSYAQQRLWFLDQLEPGLPVYNIPVVIRLTGKLDVNALEHTFCEVARRHEVLRTSFAVVEGQPVQVIAPALDLTLLPVRDLQPLTDKERVTEVERLARREAREPFDLTTGPMIRASLLRLSDSEHVLLFTMHHIVSDGWSLGVLFKEVAALYEAFKRGRPSPLPELKIQYADYAAWQREWLSGEALEAQLEYWRKHLGGDLPVLELPTDKPRRVVTGLEGSYETFVFPEELVQELHVLSRAEGVTLFITLLAAFQSLLARYSSQSQIIVGTPIANRNRRETEALIGFFVNTLALRTDLGGDPPFRQLMERVKEVAMGGYSHQDVPFEKLVEELQPERDMSHSPLFQVVFALQNAPGGRLELPDLVLDYIQSDNGTTHFDLSFLLAENEEGLCGYLEYNTALFDARTIRGYISHYRTLLESIVADPDRRLSELPLLNEAERRQLLEQWSVTRTAYPQHATIQQLFEAQAEQTPQAVALVFYDERLKYAELNARANQLAHHLRRLGVGPEVRVGLCIERSTELIVGLLGILKAGGAYVPVDPLYPQERIEFMLENAQAPVLLTQRRLIKSLPKQSRQVLCIDSDWEKIARESEENPTVETEATNLAYVMYTSGSTGRPKGVSVVHRSVVRLVKETNYASLDRAQRFLQLAPISFDASTLEIWGSLLNGAQLVIAPPQTLSLQELGALIREAQITTLWLTSGLFHQMVEHELDNLKSVRQLLAGGDVLSSADVKKALRELEQVIVINGYGPTENTTFTCCAPMTNPDHIGTTVSIGYPIANTEIYVLDAKLQPVPVGIYGELYIGGDGLARNYHQRPALTAERFLPHPFSAQAGARLYRSGDMVRYLSDGSLEFLGRADSQVKVRGFRIELGEIEAALSEHEKVREAVVIAREDEPGEKRLVAYLVPHTEDVWSVAAQANDALEDATVAVSSEIIADVGASLTGELREYLRKRLPEHMVPSHFVLLTALPLSPNGKVERRALPPPQMADVFGHDDYARPRSEMEEVLAGIWSQVLKAERVGVEDNFFELGGHSLLATRVISRVREVFGVEIPLRSLFESPTVCELASRVREAQGRPSANGKMPPLVSHVRQPGKGSVLSFAQQRFWLMHQLDPGSAVYNIPFAARLDGHLNVAALKQTLDEIVRRHEVLRTTFALIHGQPRQIIESGLDQKLPIVDLKGLDPQTQELVAQRLAGKEASRPFDLARGPLLRTTLLRLDKQQHLILFTMHHIVSDEWSMNLLIRELAAHYQAYATGTPLSLPALPIQYADFAIWQQQLGESGMLEEQLAYWKEQLRPPLNPLDLPTDRPRSDSHSYRGATHRFTLERTLTQGLRVYSRSQGVTLYMTLLGALQSLLYRYTGEEDVRVGTAVANRGRAETGQVMGCFINTMVIRTRMGGNPRFEEVMKRVREGVLGGEEHSEVGYEAVLEAVMEGEEGERARQQAAPLFQVWFVLLRDETESLKSVGLEIKPLTVELGLVPFELVIVMKERAEVLSCEWSYNAELFDAETIEEMAQRYTTLLERVAAENIICGVLDIPLDARTAAQDAETTTETLLPAASGEQEQYVF
jgi:amino acid adenylation domain-containing protein